MRRVPTDPSSIDPENGSPTPLQPRRQRLAYGAASQAVFAILISAGIGYCADGRFDTSPLFLLLGTAVGFAAFVHRLLQLGHQLRALDTPESPPHPPGTREP